MNPKFLEKTARVLEDAARVIGIMFLEPTSIEELQTQLAATSARHGKVAGVNLRAVNRIIEYTPEDMVVTVQTGVTLAALQMELRKHNQWLPIDPPEADATIEGIISRNLSGPRRLAFGVIRDHLLGLTALLADGTRISGGGKVVKNVAGFDLPKLFVGARGTLGIPVEASFKLLPLPERESFARARFDFLSEAQTALARLAEKRLWPGNLDLCQLEPKGPLILLAGFAGAREDVEAQIESARELGFKDDGSIVEQLAFWKSGGSPKKYSVLPSELFATIERIKPSAFLARAGNGILYCQGGAAVPASLQAPRLLHSLKQAYDPNGVFPEFCL